MLTERDLDTGAITLHYAEGPDAGPPLVLLHGLTGNWQSMQIFFPVFTPAWHVYACDLRGHGGSGRIAGDYRLIDYVKDIATFLRGQVGAPAVLMGHSLGALTALGTAAQAPEQVRGLVLLDPPLYLRNAGVEARAEAAEWFAWVRDTVTTAGSVDAVAARLHEMDPGLDAPALQEMAEGIVHVAPGTVDVTLQNRLLEGFDLEAALERIACPTLLMHGDWDAGAAVRAEDVELVRAHLPGAQIVRMPGAGHGFPYEQTEATLGYVRPFLEALD